MQQKFHRLVYTRYRSRQRWLTFVLASFIPFLLPSCGTITAPSPAVQTTSIPGHDGTATLPALLTPGTLPRDLPVNTLPPVVSPSPGPTLENTRYVLTAELDYGLHHLNVEEKISYVNHTSESLPDLLLMVEPLYYPGVFRLNRLNWGDGQAVTGFDWEGSQLRIPLNQPLPPGRKIDLSLTYELNLPSPVPSLTTRPVPFGYTARQTNLVDWYPFLPPYVPGEGWLAHPAGYFGEHLVYDVADFQVNIRLLDARQDLIIAASSPDTNDGDWHRFELDAARNFAWSVSHEYLVDQQTVGKVTILGYAFPFHANAGKTATETTAKALELYSSLFGPYPHSTLTVVEADFLDGMEYDGLYFLSNGFYNLYQGNPGEYLVTIAAHETAHQWWYALVGNDQAQQPWLDEALATYSERIFYEHLYPEALDWWWEYRINYYEPQGWIDGSIYDFGGNLQPYRAYRDAIYLNGALFLEDLRKLIGDDAFYAFLKDYADQNAHRLATSDSFFSILKEHTQTDYMPLKKKYFSKP